MTKQWWKEAVIYQIYPRSFYDCNGDGIGDIPGIIQKLDYIKSLGVDVIWLCPVYSSPNDDNGYDISDYYNIHPDFGDLADFDQLLEGIHARGMKLLMDLVVNHTSDEHPWFQESRASKANPKRDYYIWKSGKNGGPPNNWQSFFGGSAWVYDEVTDEYFLHYFTKKQPDLNWENPEVRQEVYALMRFWLDKGIDGFRMDVISLISKRGYEDAPNVEFTEVVNKVFANGPRIHEFLKEMNEEVLRHYDVMTVGEGPGIDLENALNYVGVDAQELNMVFHFDHMFMDHGQEGKFDPVKVDFVKFKEVFLKWDHQLKDKGWGSIFLGNHDFPRIVSRFGNDKEYRRQSAKALSMLLLTLRGTSYIYQGDELGMTNVAFDRIDDYNDVETFNVYREWKEKGKDLSQLMKAIHTQGRDNARTPIQWNGMENAGFTTGKPWIKVNPNYLEINADFQETDENSILKFYRKMVAYRKSNPTLVYGDFEVLDLNHPQVFAYRRWDAEYEFFVFINFSNQRVEFTVPTVNFRNLTLEISNLTDAPKTEKSMLEIPPWGACLFKS